MLRLLRNKRAQNTMEYALLITIVIGAFTAMQLYLRRGLSARVKEGLDNIPSRITTNAGGMADGVFGSLTQYEPYYIQSGSANMVTTSSEGTEQGIVGASGGQRDLTGATSSRRGYQNMTGTDYAD